MIEQVSLTEGIIALAFIAAVAVYAGSVVVSIVRDIIHPPHSGEGG